MQKIAAMIYLIISTLYSRECMSISDKGCGGTYWSTGLSSIKWPHMLRVNYNEKRFDHTSARQV